MTKFKFIIEIILILLLLPPSQALTELVNSPPFKLSVAILLGLCVLLSLAIGVSNVFFPPNAGSGNGSGPDRSSGRLRGGPNPHPFPRSGDLKKNKTDGEEDDGEKPGKKVEFI